MDKILRELKERGIIETYTKVKEDSYWGIPTNAEVFWSELIKRGAWLEEYIAHPSGFWILTSKRGYQNIETPLWRYKMKVNDKVYTIDIYIPQEVLIYGKPCKWHFMIYTKERPYTDLI